MNKIIWTLIIAIMFILGFGAWDIRQNNIKSISMGMGTVANAGIFDDIGAAITGHIDDYKDRSKADEFIPGLDAGAGEFTFSKDAIHYAEGSVKLVYDKGLTYVQLGKDFNAGFAPDLYIFTSTKAITSQHAVDIDSKMNLTKLKKGSGASYYLLDNAEDIKSIVIWCKRFNQWMGTALIK